MNPSGRASTLVALVAFCAVACGSSGFDGHHFKNDQLAFRLEHVPPEWRQLQVDGALVAFRSDAAHATLAVNGRCGEDGDDVPLVALTHHLFLDFTKRTITDQHAVSLDGREALRTELVASLDGVEKHYAVYVLKKDGCVYDFLAISDARGDFEVGPSFDTFVGGFHAISP